MKPLWRVRCQLPIRSQRIVPLRSKGQIIELDLGRDMIQAINSRWIYLPDHLFKLLADNRRQVTQQGIGDYTMEDGRRVCRFLQGRKARIIWEGYETDVNKWYRVKVEEII